jgi:hypothetical protein
MPSFVTSICHDRGRGVVSEALPVNSNDRADQVAESLLKYESLAGQ